jgi:hypothetical protein
VPPGDIDYIFEGKMMRISVIAIVLGLGYGVWGSGIGFCQEQDPPLSYYEIIEQRNFFRPAKDATSQQDTERRPEYPLPSTAAQAGDLRLTGIVRIKGRLKAIIEKESGNRGYYVGLGDMVDDYEVKDIQPDGIILDRNGQISVLKLKVVSSKKKKEEPQTTLKEEADNEEETETEETQEEITTESIKYKSNIMQNLRKGEINKGLDIDSDVSFLGDGRATSNRASWPGNPRLRE